MKIAAESPSSEPDYKEGFALQRIRRIKEISTRVILVGLVIMVTFRHAGVPVQLNCDVNAAPISLGAAFRVL